MLRYSVCAFSRHTSVCHGRQIPPLLLFLILFKALRIDDVVCCMDCKDP